jgi:hypothetical protein
MHKEEIMNQNIISPDSKNPYEGEKEYPIKGRIRVHDPESDRWIDQHDWIDFDSEEAARKWLEEVKPKAEDFFPFHFKKGEPTKIRYEIGMYNENEENFKFAFDYIDMRTFNCRKEFGYSEQ